MKAITTNDSMEMMDKNKEEMKKGKKCEKCGKLEKDCKCKK